MTDKQLHVTMIKLAAEVATFGLSSLKASEVRAKGSLLLSLEQERWMRGQQLRLVALGESEQVPAG
jgi:hypothetical protein